jgi:hydrogenase/urease accessory protein HupE
VAFQIPGLVAPPVAISIVVMLTSGALLALDWKLPFKIVIAITGLFGLLLGFFNGASLPEKSIIVMIGAVTAAFIAAVLSAALAVALNHGWTRIAIRVAGSWLTALGLLALGWSLRNQ